MKFLERDFPSMVPRYEKLYSKKYPPEAYRKDVKGMVRVLQQRYGLPRRDETKSAAGGPEGIPEEMATPEQVGFAW